MKFVVFAALAASSLFGSAAEARGSHSHYSHRSYSSYHSHRSYGSDAHYTNSRGHSVHRPMYASSQPSGASARCGDGSWSFSQSHRGTCSHHGGVSSWL
jgi:hypothetical protein